MIGCIGIWLLFMISLKFITPLLFWACFRERVNEQKLLKPYSEERDNIASRGLDTYNPLVNDDYRDILMAIEDAAQTEGDIENYFKKRERTKKARILPFGKKNDESGEGSHGDNSHSDDESKSKNDKSTNSET